MINLMPHDYLINQHIHKLDQVTVEYEAKWGVGRLEKLVSENLAQKWNSQKDKLNDAIRDRDPARVAALVDGCVRGYAALEAEALKNGHTLNPPEWWDVQHESGRVYRIVKSEPQSRLAAQGCLSDGVTVYTLQEVARLLDSFDHVNKVKDSFTEAKVVKIAPDKPPCDFKNGGDACPF